MSITSMRAGRRLTRSLCRRAVPVGIGLAVAASLVLTAPSTAASAAPEPKAAASSPDDRPPPGYKKAYAKVNGAMVETWYPELLDPNDPHFHAKYAGSVLVKGVMGRGLGAPSLKDGLLLAQGVVDHLQGTSQTVKGLKKQVEQSSTRIEELKKAAKDKTKSAKERAATAGKLAKEREINRVLNSKYNKAKKQATDFDWDAEVKRLENIVKDKAGEVRRSERSTRTTSAHRQQLKDELAAAREELAKANADRKKLGGPDDEDGAGTTTRKTSPPKGPTTSGAKTSPKQSAAVPSKTGTGKTGLTVPRGSRGNAMSSGATDLIGQGLADGYQEYLRQEDAELLERAKRDPVLRRSILDDYHRYPDRNPWEKTIRGFENGSKGFTQSAAQRLGPTLERYQPNCGAFDVCTQNSPQRLGNVKAKSDSVITDATRQARSTAPRTSGVPCGAYDVCDRNNVPVPKAKKLAPQCGARDVCGAAPAEAGVTKAKATTSKAKTTTGTQCGARDVCGAAPAKAGVTKAKTTTSKAKTTNKAL